MNILRQRFILSAASLPQSVPASTTFGWNVVTASVPLSGLWVLRFRNAWVQIVSGDTSGKLSVPILQAYWQLSDSRGNGVTYMHCFDNTFTPSFAMPALANVGAVKVGYMNQVLSSLDITGGIAVTATLNGGATVLNTDAGAAHTFTLSVYGIIEFDDAGSE